MSTFAFISASRIDLSKMSSFRFIKFQIICNLTNKFLFYYISFYNSYVHFDRSSGNIFHKYISKLYFDKYKLCTSFIKKKF